MATFLWQQNWRDNEIDAYAHIEMTDDGGHQRCLLILYNMAEWNIHLTLAAYDEHIGPLTLPNVS